MRRRHRAAEDGGYALIACRRAPRPIFERIEWGGNEVAPQTVARLARCVCAGARCARYGCRPPEDVERLGGEDSS